MIQFIIAVTGITAIALTQQSKFPTWKKFAPVFGLIGQPFWIISTYQTNQYGIFTLCCCYLFLWSFGLYNAWIANDFHGWKEFRQKDEDVECADCSEQNS